MDYVQATDDIHQHIRIGFHVFLPGYFTSGSLGSRPACPLPNPYQGGR